MWPDIGIKSSRNFPKCSQSRFALKSDFFGKSPKAANIWATFVIKFIVKNFQKTSNLVTLALSHIFWSHVWVRYTISAIFRCLENLIEHKLVKRPKKLIRNHFKSFIKSKKLFSFAQILNRQPNKIMQIFTKGNDF